MGGIDVTAVVAAANVTLKYAVFDLAYHGAAAQLIPLRHSVGYWAGVASFLALSWSSSATPLPAPLSLACFFASYALLPYLCWDAPRTARLAGAATLVAIELLTEAVGMAWYAAAVSAPIAQGSAELRETAMRSLNVVILLALATAARRVPSRLGLPERPGSGARDGRYGWFFALQVVAASALFASALGGSPHAMAPGAVAAMAVCTALCAAADVVATASMRRAAASALERARADALGRRLADHVDVARHLREEGERVARFRHDERNHLGAIEALLGRGEGGRALAYVRDLRRNLRAGK